jgi:hypothetical protein
MFKIHRAQPFPFIFASKNYAATKNGASAWFYNYGQTTYESPTHPTSMLVDSNRQSYAEFKKMAPYTSQYATVRFNLANSIVGDIDIITIESDPMYPYESIASIKSYSDPSFSLNETIHTISYEIFSGGTYVDGTSPRRDASSSHFRLTDTSIEGVSGRCVVIFLRNKILSTRPYVMITFSKTGRNTFGYDGSFDNGIWYGDTAASLETASPPPVHYGETSRYIVYDASSATEYGRWTTLPIKKDEEVILMFQHKRYGTYNPSQLQYCLDVSYLDEDGTGVGTCQLIELGGAGGGSWETIMARINYLYLDGKRYSSDTTTSPQIGPQLVPANVAAIMWRFKVLYYAGYTTKWAIDDVACYRRTLPMERKYAVSKTQAGLSISMYEHFDMSGTMRIREVGMFSYNFAMSQYTKKKLPSGWMPMLQEGQQPIDLAGFAGPNFISDSKQAKGAIAMRDINGGLTGTVVPSTGLKRTRTLAVVCTKEQMEMLEDIFGLGLFSLITPQSEWGEYIAVDGSNSWNTVRDNRGSDYLWTGQLQIEET